MGVSLMCDDGCVANVRWVCRLRVMGVSLACDGFVALVHFQVSVMRFAASYTDIMQAKLTPTGSMILPFTSILNFASTTPVKSSWGTTLKLNSHVRLDTDVYLSEKLTPTFQNKGKNREIDPYINVFACSFCNVYTTPGGVPLVVGKGGLMPVPSTLMPVPSTPMTISSTLMPVPSTLMHVPST